MKKITFTVALGILFSSAHLIGYIKLTLKNIGNAYKTINLPNAEGTDSVEMIRKLVAETVSEKYAEVKPEEITLYFNEQPLSIETSLENIPGLPESATIHYRVFKGYTQDLSKKENGETNK